MNMLPRRYWASVLLLLLIPPSITLAQVNRPTPPTADEIVKKGIQAVGGDRYLNVNTIIGRGLFTEYRDGVSGIPVKFVDYIVYPDKERTEFNGGGARIIQTNVQGGGWLFDGAAKTIKDQTPAQLEDFRISMRTSFENLLRGWWRTQGATLSYVGRREAGLAKRNETVKLTYPDGFWVEYELGASDGLPSKVLYERKSKKPDSTESEDNSEEDRLLKPITIDGVTLPFVVDHFRNGIQTSRIAYDSVDLNKPISDSMFVKPANIKAIK